MATKLPDHLANMSVEEFKKQKSLGEQLSKKQKAQFSALLIWAVDNKPEKARLLVQKFGYILSPTMRQRVREKLQSAHHPMAKKVRAEGKETARKILADPAGALKGISKNKMTKDNAR